MQGKHLVIGLLAALVAAAGFVFWLAATSSGRMSDGDLARTASPPDSGVDHDERHP